VEAGGCLISEFEADTSGAPWTFPKRNRLMAGISHATFVVEAARPSGTLITSGLAGQYNRDVFALPGSIFSALAEGPHMLINEGACIVRSSKDILHALGFEVKEIKENSLESETALSPQENILLGILNEPLQKNETLQKLINEHSIPTNEANALISMMELGGYIREEMGTLYRTKVDHGDT
jgi:DNA processing protein